VTGVQTCALPISGWYRPTPRGLEVKIGEKLALLRKWDKEAGKK
jgi:putative ATPase